MMISLEEESIKCSRVLSVHTNAFLSVWALKHWLAWFPSWIYLIVDAKCVEQEQHCCCESVPEQICRPVNPISDGQIQAPAPIPPAPVPAPEEPVPKPEVVLPLISQIGDGQALDTTPSLTGTPAPSPPTHTPDQSPRLASSETNFQGSSGRIMMSAAAGWIVFAVVIAFAI